VLRALLALLALFGASEACAHAALIATIPADGAALEAAPAEIILRFNEPVTPLVVRLRAASGSIVALPAPAAHGEEIRIPAPAEMRDGAFVLSFRVTSLDSHPVSGSIQFSIGTATIDAATTANVRSTWEWAVAAMRVLHYCALLVAALSPASS
jgi:copper transport protein